MAGQFRGLSLRLLVRAVGDWQSGVQGSVGGAADRESGI